MEHILSIIVTITIYIIYCNLFLKAGENPSYAFIPLLNTYTLCKIADTMWAFWAYAAAGVAMALCAIAGNALLIILLGVVILVIDIIVYVRLVTECIDGPFLPCVLIVLQIFSAFI